MSAEWWRCADGDGYTSNIDHADPWDITRKSTARHGWPPVRSRTWSQHWHDTTERTREDDER